MTIKIINIRNSTPYFPLTEKTVKMPSDETWAMPSDETWAMRHHTVTFQFTMPLRSTVTYTAAALRPADPMQFDKQYGNAVKKNGALQDRSG